MFCLVGLRLEVAGLRLVVGCDVCWPCGSGTVGRGRVGNWVLGAEGLCSLGGSALAQARPAVQRLFDCLRGRRTAPSRTTLLVCLFTVKS